MYHKSTGYRVFSIFNHLFLIALSLLCILPLMHVLAVSFSGKSAATANIVNLWPVDFTLESYEKTIDNPAFIRALLYSVYRTVLGTAVGMAVIVFAGYALSKRNAAFKSRNAYMWFFVFTMLFSGGLVPGYILITELQLINTIWALILPTALSVYNMILLMNFFRTIPAELEEAALIDGAGLFRILFSIHLPVSMPALATITLFTLVGHWNSWFDGLIYMMDTKKYPLATFLQTVVVQQDFSKMSINPQDMENLSQRTVKAAQIFIGALPILLVYPFLQKYFVKGIVLGAVKE
ncbi:carbohydrate ABC transporter permease [Paenibacillus harenae]|uniref:Aldouronate transport system permease protein n=1 Tax=Paenibacillus harenae TaxID=306543 RepID=A0ABT9TYR9_PAEHA|nr:carbohydrate ABC transporter permease [Paenibacillus harenae]MDQ0060312.1 putative aldouronate transport system permease protein [Paenibacillus harenae]MDQ0112152.1 putative aldouronate transport system permease protein [Paenibacillus harenae]